ncbi:hypothetical protein TNCT_350251 [Trichonephila clavata]|uniref:Uncharacterized protein n=1 Tax=Trichonephila clavata TaxID=2740835 RepID=A0A8X6L193_TRICU|nr:hypothetical protein TNCT_350251 [Trichonephila clavata]
MAFARAFSFIQPKEFRHPFLGEDAPLKYCNFGFFFFFGIGRERKPEYCGEGCSESNDSPLKQKVSVEMFAMDNAQKSGIGMDVPERLIGVTTVNSSAAGSPVKEVRGPSLRIGMRG